MLFGLVTIKPMKKYKGQFIGTRFVVIGIPIVPIQSYFFMSDFQGVDIGFYWPQVAKAYVLFISIIATILLGFHIKEPDYMFGYGFPLATAWLLFLLCIAAFIYFAFFIGKMTEEEKALRELYGQAVGMNALPQYLDNDTARRLCYGFEADFKHRYNADWQAVLQNRSYQPQQLPKLFAILGYKCRLTADAQVHAWYGQIYAEYKAVAAPAAEKLHVF